jgi:hypothetical protein
MDAAATYSANQAQTNKGERMKALLIGFLALFLLAVLVSPTACTREVPGAASKEEIVLVIGNEGKLIARYEVLRREWNPHPKPHWELLTFRLVEGQKLPFDEVEIYGGDLMIVAPWKAPAPRVAAPAPTAPIESPQE